MNTPMVSAHVNTRHKEMLVPGSERGTKDTISVFPGYEWIKKLPNKKIYFALFQDWVSTDNLPDGYDYYIVSFHLEPINIPWLKQQKVTGLIIVLSGGTHYDLKLPGVHFVSFFYWHYQLKQMQDWFGVKEKITPTYKFSAVCNRVSQSKVWIITKLLETAKESSLVVLNSWLKEKNVHGWQATGNTTLDQLTQVFRDCYSGKEIKIDNFDNATQNKQNITGNPWQPLYQDCAVNFTNESFHYSRMIEDGQEYIWPGPFITEKTLKCLLGGTAFIPVGQFETYKTLTNLGFEFHYDFDITWDLDPGNITRAEKIINLIDQLNQFDVSELVTKTQHSSKHNQNHIVSDKFYQTCNDINATTVDEIVKIL
jgi:hypothetical protein